MWRNRKVEQEATECGLSAQGPDKQFGKCNTKSCTVDKDCILSSWSDWSPCSCTRDGVKRRSRIITAYGAGAGKFCHGKTKEIMGCHVDAIPLIKLPLPCVMGDWDDWGKCSTSCGPGERERRRDVEVAAQNGGTPCQGDLNDIEQCDVAVCPAPAGPKGCRWGKWMEWGACDKCGGQRKRTRQIHRMPELGGTPCQFSASEETTACKRQCHDPLYCVWTDWEEEGHCSTTCGAGSVKRIRYLQPSKVAPKVIDEAALYEQGLVAGAQLQARRRREVFLSFFVGGGSAFVAILVVMAVMRRRPVHDYNRLTL